MPSNKPITLLSIFAGLIVLAAGLVIFHAPSTTQFACAYPKFSSVHEGMSKVQVSGLLGSTYQDKVKYSQDQNLFGQGTLEKDIKEGWIYQFSGWEGSIEIYFDPSGTVIGKNCGEG